MFLCRALAASVEVFLHRVDTFGERYLGVQAWAAVLLICFYSVFWEHHDVEPLFIFAAIYGFLCVCVRARVIQRRKRGGPHPHTMYTGQPYLLALLMSVSESKIKAVAEPALVWLAGALMMSLSEPLGGYLLLAGCALAIVVNTALANERKRALDMHDAFMEQRRIAERFRDMRGE